MDSVTQFALGAAVGHATLGRQVGRRAVLWGGICGTLPDLDVLISYGSPVANFTYHRSFSHSLVVLALITPVIVAVVRRLHPGHAQHWVGWSLLVYLSFATHVLLDALTVYGTQLLWPMDSTPFSWGTVFIIDPLFTLPLLVGVTAAVTMKRTPERARRWNLVGLAVGVLYMSWGAGAKAHAHSVARDSLTKQGISYQRLLTVASPFNTILWRFVAIEGDRYYEGAYSLLDSDTDIEFTPRPRSPELLVGLEEHWPVKRLQWFTHGFYGVDRIDDDIVVTDLRMGSFDTGYVFRFAVGRVNTSGTSPMTDRMLSVDLDFDQLGSLWKRLRGEE